MPRTVEFNGVQHEFPDNATDDQVRAALTGHQAGVMSQIGEGVSHFLSGINPVNLVTGARDMVNSALTSSPSQTAKNLNLDSSAQQQKIIDSVKGGRYIEAARHIAGLLPIVGPQIDKMGDEAQSGNVGAALGDAAAFGVTNALPASPLVGQALAKAKATVVPKFANPNPVDAAAVQFGQARGIPVDAATATGNQFVAGAQKLADHSPIGSVIAQRARQATQEGMQRVGGELAAEAHPQATTPLEAGTDTTGSIENNIRQHAAIERQHYGTLEELAADPVNTQAVRQTVHGTPEEMALPADVSEAQKMLRPIRDNLERGMSKLDMDASKGFKVLNTIVEGPRYIPAVQLDQAIGLIKGIARGSVEDMPELKTLGQGLASHAIGYLEKSVQDALGKAQRSVPSGNGTQTAAVQPGATGEGQNLQQASGAGGQTQAAQSGAAATPSPDTVVKIPGEYETSYPARYEVKEIADIQPSHQGATFQPNPKYSGLNERDYENPLNRGKVVNASTEATFDPTYHINDNPDATNGPPVVDSSGNVQGGNGRAMMAQRVYAAGGKAAQAYRDLLAQKAAQFGIDPKTLEGMKEPYLVRTIADQDLGTGAARQNAVADFNKVGTAPLTPAERAIADARRLSPETLDHISEQLTKAGPDATLAQALEGQGGLDALDRLIQDGAISRQQRPEFAGKDELTPAGKARISQALLGRFFKNAAEMDSFPAAMKNKLERIAPILSKTEGSGGFNLSGHMQDAVSLLEDYRKSGAANWEDYDAQHGMFGNPAFSQEAQALAKALQSTNPLALTDAVRSYAEHAKYAGEYQGPGLFGEFPEPHTPTSAFNEAFGTNHSEPAAEPVSEMLFKGHPEKDWRTGEPIKAFNSANGKWAGYFSDSEDVAKRFASAHDGPKRGEWPAAVTSAKVSLKSPLVVDAKGAPAGDFALDSHVLGKSGNAEMQAAIENPAYDGIIIRNTRDEGNVWIPKTQDQITNSQTRRFARGEYVEPGPWNHQAAAPAAAPVPPITNSPQPPPKVRPAGTPAGPEALNALKQGRAATVRKYDAMDVRNALPNRGAEGAGVFERLTAPGDKRIEQLREVARQSPQIMPQLGRAYLENVLGTQTIEGLNKGLGMFRKWDQLGAETKRVLFPNPLLVKDLDNFFSLAKKAAADVNPSNTASVLSIAGGMGAIFAHPASGIPMVIGTGALSKMLHSPAGVAALTNGLRVSVRNTAQASFAAARILKLAGDAARPANASANFPQAAQAANPQPSAPLAMTASR